MPRPGLKLKDNQRLSLLTRTRNAFVALSRRHRRLARRLRFVLKVSSWIFLICAVEVIFHIRSYRIPRPARDLDGPFATECQDPLLAAEQARENATFVMLTRNSEVETARQTIENIERKFNQWFHYPVLFLNDEEWSPEFVRLLNDTVSGQATFDVIPKADWVFPGWMDTEEARAAMKLQGEKGIYNGGMESYHHMCRFYSGNFYSLEALKKYKWYWRLEPGVQFTCAITYDPFVEMARNGKSYGFTVALWEVPETCPSLFRAIDDFRVEKNLPANPMWNAMVDVQWHPWPLRRLLGLLGVKNRDRNGNRWNLCHYWSNFEIADLDFFRSKPYQELFEHLDRTKGFYQERWGDAPVHSLAVHLLLPPGKLHHFSDVGYTHEPFFQCPGNAPGGQLTNSTAFGSGSWSKEVPGAIGCRCECSDDRKRNNRGICLNTMQAPSAFHRPTFMDRYKGNYPYTINIQ